MDALLSFSEVAFLFLPMFCDENQVHRDYVVFNVINMQSVLFV